MANLYTVIATGHRERKIETRDLESAIRYGRIQLVRATGEHSAEEVQVWLNGKIVHLENNYRALVKNIDMGDYSEDFDYTEGG